MEPVQPPLTDAEAIAKEFKEFTYIISHDFSAPLRGMVEFSRLLRDEQGAALNDEGRLYLSLIAEGGEKLQAMLAGLLEYSRLNTMAKRFVKVDCAQVLKDCQQVLENQMKKLGGKITADKSFLPNAMGDIDQLMQLFMALFDNSIKYRSPDRPLDIHVSASLQGKYWQVTVRDNGIGVDPQFADRIFKPFQRLHTAEEYPGVGMGLSFCRKIVERHGGTLRCDAPDSKPGASFTFTLPCS